MMELLQRHVGAELLERTLDPAFTEAVMAIPDHEVWTAHVAQKHRLMRFVMSWKLVAP